MFREKYIEKQLLSIDVNLLARNLTELHEKHKKCELINDILHTVVSNLQPTEENLKENLLINPSKQFYWFKFITSKKAKFYLCEIIHSFNLKIAKSICDESIRLEDVQYLLEHSNEKKEAFNEYIRLTLEYKKEAELLKKFKSKLKEAVNIYSQTERDVNYLNILLTQYCNTPDLQTEIETFQKFSNDYKHVKINSFVFPENLKPLKSLIIQIYPVLNSAIYKNYFSKNTDSINRENFVEIVLNCYEEMKDNMTQIAESVGESDINTIYSSFSEIKIENIAKEIKIIETIIEKGQENIPLLKKVLESLEEQKTLVSFCSDVLASLKSINLTDLNFTCLSQEIIKEKDERNINTVVFTERIAELSKTINNYLENVDKNTIFNFFKEVKNSEQLLKFTNGLQQEELDHLQEGIDETSQNSGLTAELIFPLTNVWSFFSVFKEGNEDFSLYCKSIDEKLRIDKYAQLLKNMQDCTKNITLITELYSDLHYQEKAKKKKIEMIVNHSALKFTKEKEYNIDLSVFKNNE